jgi:hypothetical protein
MVMMKMPKPKPVVRWMNPATIQSGKMYSRDVANILLGDYKKAMDYSSIAISS